MSFEEILGGAREAMNVKHVFGEPYERNGVTVIPAAKVSGGGGGGSGRSGDEEKGWGGGFGIRARPVGVYVIRGDSVTWIPAVDVNRALVVGGVVAFFALWTLRSVVKTIARRR